MPHPVARTRRRTAPKPRTAAAATDGAVPLDLALQGGGSHGAFTWGVLDRLLDEPRLRPVGVSGTSAGAINAAVLATGLARGGPAGAQAALRAFWLDVAATGACFGAFTAPAPGPFGWPATPWAWWAQQAAHWFTPAQLDPFELGVLRDVVRRHVDDAALRDGPLEVFVVATSVRTGQPRVFDRADIGLDALLASACLPQLFRPVTIDGEPYWDGGYSGNPALWPLIYATDAVDLLLVKTSPLVRPTLPRTAAEIADRVNEITFNAGLVGEMRAIAFVQKLFAQGRVDAGAYKNLRLHLVGDEEGLGALHPSSKLHTERGFLERLHALGHAAASRWLAAHGADVGVRGTLDVAATFLGPRAGAHAPGTTLAGP